MAAAKANAAYYPFQIGVLRRGGTGSVPGQPVPIIIEKQTVVARAES